MFSLKSSKRIVYDKRFFTDESNLMINNSISEEFLLNNLVLNKCDYSGNSVL